MAERVLDVGTEQKTPNVPQGRRARVHGGRDERIDIEDQKMEQNQLMRDEDDENRDKGTRGWNSRR